MFLQATLNWRPTGIFYDILADLNIYSYAYKTVIHRYIDTVSERLVNMKDRCVLPFL